MSFLKCTVQQYLSTFTLLCNQLPDLFFFWRLITLQYCSGFCHTLTWISHEYTCVLHPELPSHFPPPPISQCHPSAPALSTLSYASNLNWWSISHMIICMFQCYSLKLSHPRHLPQSSKICSLHLSRMYGHYYHLPKFHIYALIYCIVFFFLTYFTLYNRLQFHPPH